MNHGPSRRRLHRENATRGIRLSETANGSSNKTVYRNGRGPSLDSSDRSVSFAIRRLSKGSSRVLQGTASEVKRLAWSDSVRVSVLLREEVSRAQSKNRHLIFPEAPGIWDTFWIGLLFVFVVSVIPGIVVFCCRRYPNHWRPLHQSVSFNNNNGVDDMQLYETAGYGIVTPLQKPMPTFFFLHVTSAFLASALLIILFTTGRVMRWRLADGTVKYDSADDLHRLFAFWSSILWTIIIVSGTCTIPLLHPTLQIANYAEMAGVLTMFIGALLSAYSRQWVLHRLCAWGLIYSAAASVFVGFSGRLLQAVTELSAYEIKAIGYTVAFCVPIVGLVRDIVQEMRKLTRDNEEIIQTMAQQRYQRDVNSHRLKFVEQIKPFKGARTDKMRRLSLFQHIAASEPEEEFERRRSTAISPSSKPKLRPRLSSGTLAHLNDLYECPSSPEESPKGLVRISTVDVGESFHGDFGTEEVFVSERSNATAAESYRSTLVPVIEESKEKERSSMTKRIRRSFDKMRSRESDFESRGSGVERSGSGFSTESNTSVLIPEDTKERVRSSKTDRIKRKFEKVLREIEERKRERETRKRSTTKKGKSRK